MEKSVNITVFTPTFNRAYIIEQLYRSLQRQSYRDFEWVLVDDGSTDGTEDLIKKWQNETNDFPIRYYKQENGGKCRAINHALDLAMGRLFFTVDSDDYLTDDALEKIVKWVSLLPKNEQFCGIAGNLGTSPTQTTNRMFEGDYFEGTLLDRYRSVDGERAIVFFTDVHRKYKYPEFENEKFMTEAVAYNRMANDGYKIRFYNDIIWIYEYKDDGLTKSGNSLFINNPKGYGLWLREKAKFMKYSFWEKIKMYYTFACDLSDKYDSHIISDSIGGSLTFIRLLLCIHTIVCILYRK